MSYVLTARPVMTGFFWGDEPRAEFKDDDFNPIDASDFVPLGSCFLSYGKPAQRMAARQYMDAYEYTDATAKHTDCASEAI